MTAAGCTCPPSLNLDGGRNTHLDDCPAHVAADCWVCALCGHEFDAEQADKGEVAHREVNDGESKFCRGSFDPAARESRDDFGPAPVLAVSAVVALVLVMFADALDAAVP